MKRYFLKDDMRITVDGDSDRARSFAQRLEQNGWRRVAYDEYWSQGQVLLEQEHGCRTELRETEPCQS